MLKLKLNFRLSFRYDRFRLNATKSPVWRSVQWSISPRNKISWIFGIWNIIGNWNIWYSPPVHCWYRVKFLLQRHTVKKGQNKRRTFLFYYQIINKWEGLSVGFMFIYSLITLKKIIIYKKLLGDIKLVVIKLQIFFKIFLSKLIINSLKSHRWNYSTMWFEVQTKSVKINEF